MKVSLLPPESLWQNSFHWILGRFSLGRSLLLWHARPFGWSLWTRDPPGTRSCAVPSAKSHDLGLEAAVSLDCIQDCQLGCEPQTLVYLQKNPGDWWALWDNSWNHQSPWAERQADSSRPLLRTKTRNLQRKDNVEVNSKTTVVLASTRGSWSLKKNPEKQSHDCQLPDRGGTCWMFAFLTNERSSSPVNRAASDVDWKVSFRPQKTPRFNKSMRAQKTLETYCLTYYIGLTGQGPSVLTCQLFVQTLTY